LDAFPSQPKFLAASREVNLTGFMGGTLNDVPTSTHPVLTQATGKGARMALSSHQDAGQVDGTA